MKVFKKAIVFLLFTLLLNINQNYSFALEDKDTFKGYITNKKFIPLNLKIFSIDQKEMFLIDRDLEDNSFIPKDDLKLVAINNENYSIEINKMELFIPENTKLIGYIKNIEAPKKFDKKGFYNVSFEKVICPDGFTINLSENIDSKSERDSYSPLHHAGKTTLGLIGGSLAGALASLQLGGIGLAAASNGYSLAAGAGLGGFIGTVGTAVSKGKEATIKPGDELTVAPIDELSIAKLAQINCSSHFKGIESQKVNEKVNLQILSVKEKKDMLGETSIMVGINFTNNTDQIYKLSNFFLRDSQGKEYSTSVADFNDDIFTKFPSNKTIETTLSFFVDFPKTTHWLVLKDSNFSKELGIWQLK